MPTDPYKKKLKKKFVYIIDDHADRSLLLALQEIGLKVHGDFHITGVGSAEMILDVPPWLKAEKLLIFAGLIQGDVGETIRFSRRLKKANPKAKIVFRSTFPEEGTDPIFDDRIEKKTVDHTKVIAIIREFLEMPAPPEEKHEPTTAD